MPDIAFKGLGGGKRTSWLSVGGDYKPGDPPPNGYNDWHEWAEVQHKAGLRQERCSRCRKYSFPQEIASTTTEKRVVYRTKRDAMLEQNPVNMDERIIICHKCAAE